jgi:hypothetical protein
VLAACIFIALGDAFRSGADEALLYRSCHAINRTEAFQPLQAQAHALQRTALVVLVLAGGSLVKVWGFAAGWAAETVLSVAGLAIAWAMIEPPPAPTPLDGEGTTVASHRDDAVERGPRATMSRAIDMMMVTVPAAFVSALASATGFVAQTSPRIQPVEVTALVAGLSLAEAAGSAIASRLPAMSIRAQAVLGASGALLVGLAIVAPPTSLFVVVALAALEGLTDPVRAAAIQRIAADAARARMASLASACDMAIKMIALPAAAWWRRS